MNTPDRILAVTPGDPAGIGPEILWQTLRTRAYPWRDVALLTVGARAPFDRLGAPVVEVTPDQIKVGMRPPKRRGPFVWLLAAPTLTPRKNLHLGGYQSGWAIERATRLVQKKIAAALVTGPISKAHLQMGGVPYPGHTEFLAKLCKKKHVTMMLANEKLRVTLATTHLALREVPRTLSRALLRRTIQQTVEHLQSRWDITCPHIAIAALNPHAGESGLFGNEEIRIIEPEVRALNHRARGRYRLMGPLPADTLFAKHIQAKPSERFDAVVCMYHDQGLIPVKLIDFPNTINVTLGLPIVRTSVDHGTAFDIAFQGRADPSSFQAAVRLATTLSATNPKIRSKKSS